MTVSLDQNLGRDVVDPEWFSFWPWLGRQSDRGDAIGRLASRPDVRDIPSNSYDGRHIHEARLEWTAWYDANFPSSPAGRAVHERLSSSRNARRTDTGAGVDPEPFEGDVLRLASAMAETLGLVEDLLFDCIKHIPTYGVADQLWPKWNAMVSQVAELKKAAGSGTKARQSF